MFRAALYAGAVVAIGIPSRHTVQLSEPLGDCSVLDGTHGEARPPGDGPR